MCITCRCVEDMQSSMSYDAKEKKIILKYPFRPEASVQPDNFKQVRAVQQNIAVNTRSEPTGEGPKHLDRKDLQ